MLRTNMEIPCTSRLSTWANTLGRDSRKGIARKEVAEKTGIPFGPLLEILNGERNISIGDAVKLEGVLDGIAADYWLSLQMQHDIQKAKAELAIA